MITLLSSVDAFDRNNPMPYPQMHKSVIECMNYEENKLLLLQESLIALRDAYKNKLVLSGEFRPHRRGQAGPY